MIINIHTRFIINFYSIYKIIKHDILLSQIKNSRDIRFLTMYFYKYNRYTLNKFNMYSIF